MGADVTSLLVFAAGMAAGAAAVIVLALLAAAGRADDRWDQR